jgi:hypothetical protein
MKKKRLLKEPVDHIESHPDLSLTLMIKVKLHASSPVYLRNSGQHFIIIRDG